MAMSTRSWNGRSTSCNRKWAVVGCCGGDGTEEEEGGGGCCACAAFADAPARRTGATRPEVDDGAFGCPLHAYPFRIDSSSVAVTAVATPTMLLLIFSLGLFEIPSHAIFSRWGWKKLRDGSVPARPSSWTRTRYGPRTRPNSNTEFNSPTPRRNFASLHLLPDSPRPRRTGIVRLFL